MPYSILLLKRFVPLLRSIRFKSALYKLYAPPPPRLFMKKFCLHLFHHTSHVTTNTGISQKLHKIDRMVIVHSTN